jgi:hypothetical protein
MNPAYLFGTHVSLLSSGARFVYSLLKSHQTIMHFRVLLTLLLFSLSLHQACAQVWEWVQTAGSEQNVNYGSALTTDAKGNIYVTGCHHPALHLH